MAEDIRKYIDPEVLNKISKLEFKARHIVEGFLTGMHKSPYFGFSVEFAAHREYTQGDDLRHLDWKVFGKTDNLYIKQYELETNLRSFILLDTSQSMEYKSGGTSKLELACYIAASIAYLLINQQDACGMMCFDKEAKNFVPSSTGQGHIRTILSQLARTAPDSKTDIATVFRNITEKITKRGVIFIISDLFDEPENILKALQYFTAKKHDVVIFHVWDEYELTFPFKMLTRFEGLEEDIKLFCDPLSIRRAYIEEVNSFNQQISRGCRQQMVDYHLISTDKQLDVELTKFLSTRLGTRLVRRRGH